MNIVNPMIIRNVFAMRGDNPMKGKIIFKEVRKEDIKVGDTIIYNGFFHGLLENIDEVQLERIQYENIGLTYSRAEIEVQIEKGNIEYNLRILKRRYCQTVKLRRWKNLEYVASDDISGLVNNFLGNLGIKIC